VNGSVLEERSPLSSFGFDIMAWMSGNKAGQANQANGDNGCKVHHD
jgi:hypothetical protein